MNYVQLQSGSVIATDDVSRWPEAKRLSKAKGKALLRAEALVWLREHLKPGDTVYTVLRHVSRSGMVRHIDVLYLMSDNSPIGISSYAAHALDYAQTAHGALKVSGCGMDMGFSVIHSLSSVVFRDGFECIGKGCPSNDHSNGDRDYSPHHHTCGGYALRHRWL